MGIWLSYVFLILAVLCIVGQFLITKLYQRSVRQALITSLFFVLLSSFVTLVIFFVYNGFRFGGITWYSLMLAIISSVIMIVYNVISIKIMGLGEVSIYSMFMMLGGMIVPFVEGLIVNPETNRLKLTNGLGLTFLTFFLIFQVAGVKTAKSTKKKFYLLCIIMFFINGIVGVLTSLQSNPIYPAMTSENFTILKSLIMIALSAGMIGILLLNKKRASRRNWRFARQLRRGRLCLDLFARLLRGLADFCSSLQMRRYRIRDAISDRYGWYDCADCCSCFSLLQRKTEQKKHHMSCWRISFHNFICVLRKISCKLLIGCRLPYRQRPAMA